ncbi:hypothetical protein SARC_12657, partial [Sphaeroforma arctica JP610]
MAMLPIGISTGLYAQVMVEGERIQKYRTKMVEKAPEPVFNASYTVLVQNHSKVVVDVMARNVFKADYCLGTVTLDLLDTGHEESVCVDLTDKQSMGTQVTGQLILK